LTNKQCLPEFWKCSLSCQKERGIHGTPSAERQVGKWCCLRALCRPLESGRERLRATLPMAADGSIHLIARAWAVRGVRDHL
jgi:hypothetical protein